MNHQEATTTGAAERYLLDEMSAEEREEFEEHYFSCAECAEDMRAASQLIEGVRSAQAEPASKVVSLRPARQAPRFRLPSWSYAAVAAALAVVVCYQSLIVIPGLRNRQVSEPAQVAVYLLRPETRGSVRVIPRQPGQPVVLSLDVPMASAGALEAVVQDEAGRRAAQIPVSLPNGESRASLLLPAGLAPAQYTIVLRSNSTEVGRYQFELQPPTTEANPGAK